MELQTLANLAEIFGAIVVVGALAFAAIEVSQFRRQRQDAAAIELARSFHNPQFAQALRVVLAIRPGLTRDQLRAADSEFEDAAMLVSLTFESIGIMVHRRIVSLAMVWELMGGVYLAAWANLEQWAEDVRREQGREKFDEWMQWLAEQLQRFEQRQGKTAAFLRYRSWKP
jgi:hypothetical protein